MTNIQVEKTNVGQTATPETAGRLLDAIGRAVELTADPDIDQAKIVFEKEWEAAKRPMHFSARTEEEKVTAWKAVEESLEGFVIVGRLLSYRKTEGIYFFKFDGDEVAAKIPVDTYTWKAYFVV